MMNTAMSTRNGSETANNVGCGMNIENLKFSTQHR